MPNPIETQIKERIQSFVTELDLLVRKSTLEALHGLLNGSSTPVRRGRPAGRPRGRRSSADVGAAAEAVLAHVRANDGQGVSEIAAGTGIALKDVKKAVVQLLAARQIKKTGQKRGTKYHAGAGRAAAGGTKRGKRRGRKSKAA